MIDLMYGNYDKQMITDPIKVFTYNPNIDFDIK